MVATPDWQSCVEGADIVVEASRLMEPTPLLQTAWIKPGAFVVPYGTMSAVELSLTDIMSKLVVDDWGQCKGGKFGSLRAHVETGKLSEATLHAELGQIVAGLKPGSRTRRRDQPVLASWAVAVGHRARACHAAEGEAARPRPEIAVRLNAEADAPMPAVANARMYSVNPATKAAWSEVFAWLSRESGIALDVVDHPFPNPLSDLWARSDLACGFMCGLPYAMAPRRPLALAAPVTTMSPVPGRPFYATKLVVRADSRFATLDDTFGGRVGFTVEDSQSGYNALRHHLLAYRTPDRPTLYRDSVGPLHTPRRVLDAILAGSIDVGPLDGYALALMMRHEPALAPRIRIIATTEPTPAPLLVASPECPMEIVEALRQALAAFANAPDCAALRDSLLLERFVPVWEADYEPMLRWHADALAAGYPHPA